MKFLQLEALLRMLRHVAGDLLSVELQARGQDSDGNVVNDDW